MTTSPPSDHPPVDFASRASSWARTAIGVFVALVLALLIGGSGATAQELGADEVTERFQDWLGRTHSLEGKFEQALISGALGGGIEESGVFFVARPGRMRWDYLEPERKVAIVEGGRTSLYVEEDEQLFLGRLGQGGDLLPNLLTGRGRVDELFRSELMATPSTGGSGAYYLRLLPGGEAESVEQVVIRVRPPEFAIESAEVLDAAGNRVLYRFHDLRRNKALPQDVFTFRPPAGTLVSGQH